jgi:hypothetical protein
MLAFCRLYVYVYVCRSTHRVLFFGVCFLGFVFWGLFFGVCFLGFVFWGLFFPTNKKSNRKQIDTKTQKNNHLSLV